MSQRHCSVRWTGPAVALLLAALFTGFMAPSMAQASQTGTSTISPQASDGTTKNCYVKLSAPDPESGDTSIEATLCRNEPTNQVRLANRQGSAAVSPLGGTLLVQMFDGSDYSGSALSFLGDGTCTSSGTGIPNIAFQGFESGVSSYDLFGTCSKTGLWTGQIPFQYSGDFSGIMIGDQVSLPNFNDKAKSAKVYS